MALVLIWAAVVLAFAASQVGEVRIHRYNYRRLSQAGAVERSALLARLYYALHWAVIPCAIAEQVGLGQTVSRPMVVGGLAAILIGQALRFWAIRSLGPLWTMRCMALQGQRQQRKGPYRFIDNPEYLSHIIDGVGVCLLFGAQLTMLGYLVLVLAANRRLAAAEREQILALEADELPLGPRAHSS